jgi:Arabinose efflux permease
VSERPDYGRLGALGWLHFLNDGAANYLPGVLPAVLLALGLRVGLAGAVMTALLIGQTLQPATGWLADRVGGRSLILAGVLGTSLGGALIGLAPTPILLLVLVLLMGVTNSLFHPQAIAGARLLGGHRQGFSMALFLVGGEVGRGIWPLLASLVVVNLGLPWLWLLGLPTLISVPLLRRRLPLQTPRSDTAAAIDWRAHGGPAAVLILFSMLRALAIFSATTFLPLLWHVRGHSLVDGAATITVLLIVGIVGNVGGGHLADRIGRRPVLVGSGLLGAALLVAFLLDQGLVQWMLLGLLGVMLFASLPLSILIAQDLFPENRSFGSGLALGLSNGLAALALIGLGVASDHLGPQAPLWGMVGALLLSALLALWMPVRARA